MDALKKYIWTIIIVKPRFVKFTWFRIAISQHTGILVFLESHFFLHALNDFLSSIPMMNIEVNNCNLLNFFSVSGF